MKVRVTLTLDVDVERMKERYPLAVERAGGVRAAAKGYVLGAIEASSATRNEAIRSITLQDS
ncbi:hypothetical protein OG436_29640 [Streptomyces caniferus]|uniref:hypothetical protein n=1 Tax=Streptomyces caniferus TaxID=285557 RepID=UPI002E2E1B36|nr:hypothetical protein [Streptomyces caniferus]